MPCESGPTRTAKRLNSHVRGVAKPIGLRLPPWIKLSFVKNAGGNFFFAISKEIPFPEGFPLR
jgi:hypothetical protein